jgi:hypothetical protein
LNGIVIVGVNGAILIRGLTKQLKMRAVLWQLITTRHGLAGFRLRILDGAIVACLYFGSRFLVGSKSEAASPKSTLAS